MASSGRHKKKSSRQKKKHLQQVFILLGLILVLVVVNRSLASNLRKPDRDITDSQEAFIDEIGGYAQENYAQSHVLPSVVIAQAILESDFGRSELARDYGNLFGRKAYGNEPAVTLATTEYQNGSYVTVTDNFKVYPSWRESVIDHGRLMVQGTSWDPDLYKGVRQARNYRQATRALAKAGYATDPSYADKLNEIIETYQLYDYDP